LGRGFQCGDAEGVGRVGGWGPDQFDAVAKVCDILVSTRRQVNDVNHSPVAVLPGVEAIPLDTAVGLDVDYEPWAGLLGVSRVTNLILKIQEGR
jgi:hypothetical protein